MHIPRNWGLSDLSHQETQKDPMWFSMAAPDSTSAQGGRHIRKLKAPQGLRAAPSLRTRGPGRPPPGAPLPDRPPPLGPPHSWPAPALPSLPRQNTVSNLERRRRGLPLRESAATRERGRGPTSPASTRAESSSDKGLTHDTCWVAAPRLTGTAVLFLGERQSGLLAKGVLPSPGQPGRAPPAAWPHRPHGATLASA